MCVMKYIYIKVEVLTMENNFVWFSVFGLHSNHDGAWWGGSNLILTISLHVWLSLYNQLWSLYPQNQFWFKVSKQYSLKKSLFWYMLSKQEWHHFIINSDHNQFSKINFIQNQSCYHQSKYTQWKDIQYSRWQ